MANYIKGTKIQENSISETKLDSSLQSWKETVTNHINNNDNPHNITKSSIGLDNVTNDAQVKRSELGVANGVATLDSTGKVPSGQLPSYVDDVIEGYLYNGVFYKDTSYTTSIVGESGKIYIDLPTNKTYRWTGSVYGVISETIALGELSSTAYRGDRGKIAYDHSQSAHAPSNAQANVIETIKVNGTALTPNSKAVDITIPTVGNGTITIKQGGTSKGTFTTNQNGNTTIELTDTNTTYTAGDGLSLSGTTFSNNGVRSIATGTTNGTISVNTNGNISNIGVYGLKSAAYTNSDAYAAASHTHSYLPLSGGTMSNTNVVTNLNADLLDGYHNIVQVSDWNSWVGSFRISAENTATNAPAEGFHYGYQMQFHRKPAVYYTDLITNLYRDELYFRRHDENGYGAWKQIAFLDSNVASSSKWATARTITLTGSVTGSVSIDGSANVTLATTTNHTHNYLPLSGGTITGSLTVNELSYFHSRLSMRSGAAIDFYDADGNNRGILVPYSANNYDLSFYDTAYWRVILHSGNYNSYAPKLDGTGATGTWGINISGNAATATNADTLDGYNSLQVLTSHNSNTVDLNEILVPSIYRLSDTNPNLPSSIFKYGNLLTVKYPTTDTAWQLIGSYSSDALWFRRGTWNEDGTGTLRTNAWKVIAFIDSNVASATKLKNSRTIWGQSFDGTGNVDGHIISTHTDLCLYYNTNKLFLQAAPTGIFLGEGTADTTYLSLFGKYIRLHIGSSEKMRISESGNVLIGTTTDNGQKLQVYGSILADLGNNGGILIGHKGNTIDGYANGLLTDLHLNYTSSGNLTMCKGGGNVSIGTTIHKGHRLAVSAIHSSNFITAKTLNNAGFAIGNIDESYGLMMWTEGNGHSHIQAGRTDGSGTMYNLSLQCFGGNVGIGTTSPSYKLHVAGAIRASDYLSTQYIELNGSTPFIDFHYNSSTADYTSRIIEDASGQLTVIGKLRIGSDNTTSNNYTFYVASGDSFFYDNVITSSDFSSRGDAIIDGTVSCTKLLQTSDIKYKTNIKQIKYEEALKIIENLNPVTWDWNENTIVTGSSSGFVAQEAEEFIPNAISRDNENNLSLDYTQLHSYEIRVIQEQQKEIKNLKQRLEVLESLVLQLTNKEI